MKLPFDEMFDFNGSARPHYADFHQWLGQQSEALMALKRAEADLIFRRVGITFAVYGDDAGSERTIPFDQIPRIFTAAEWSMLEAGLRQRVSNPFGSCLNSALTEYMHLKIHHRTEYRYESPVHYSIQELRLTPPDVAGQKTSKWKLHTPMKSTQSSDPFENRCHVFVQEAPYTSMVIEAEGEVDTEDAFELVDSSNAVSPFYLLQQTPLTAPSDAMLDYFSGVMPKTNQVDSILYLAKAVQDAIPYSPGKTHFATTAAQSFAMGAGVCQDHSHIMLGLCRTANIPARYVSGYFFAEESPNLASHAWIDFCIDINKGKWISVDITHACLIDSRHVRLAVGRDYYSAAPIKGVRSGGGTESLSASISIHQLS